MKEVGPKTMHFLHICKIGQNHDFWTITASFLIFIKKFVKGKCANLIRYVVFRLLDLYLRDSGLLLVLLLVVGTEQVHVIVILFLSLDI